MIFMIPKSRKFLHLMVVLPMYSLIQLGFSISNSQLYHHIYVISSFARALHMLFHIMTA